MQITRKEQLLGFLTELSSAFQQATTLAAPLLDSVNQNWSHSLASTKTLVADSVVFVPVIGSFSTGKSTALNSLLGRKILPEKVTPETAIPAELHFSEDEHILALSRKEEWTKHALSELPMLSDNASQYQLVQLYINSPYLKQIAPLVLVDMPGFDSGVAQHNESILRYATRGAMYLYMVNAKAGTVTKQDLRRIEEIVDLGRTVKVFMTMTDLVAPKDILTTQEYISDTLQVITTNEQVYTINKDDVSALCTVLAEADINKLVDTLVLNAVLDVFFDASNHLNTVIHALNSNAEDFQNQSKTAETALHAIETEQQKLLSELNTSQLTEKAEQIIRSLEQALRSNADELVMQARAGQEVLSRCVADLVRAKLTVEIQRVISRYTTDVAYQFSGSVNLGTLALPGIEENWLGNLISAVEKEAMNALTGLGSTVLKDKGAPNSAWQSLSTLAIAIPHPVLRVVFAILPGVVGTLFNNFRDKNETEQYHQFILTQFIPSVISQIRPQVESSLSSVKQEIIKTLSLQMSGKVEEQRLIYRDVAAASEAQISKINQSIDDLKHIRTDMNKLAEGVSI